MKDQLQQSVTITLDGSGNGTAVLGPSVVREYWTPNAAAVSVAPPVTREAQCNLYVGTGAIPTNQLGATFMGSTGDTCGFGEFQMVPGQSIIAKWTGGDANKQATLTVFGSRGRFDGRQ